MASITAAPSDHFPLQSLPGEIKNRIYRYTVVDEHSIRLSIRTTFDEDFNVSSCVKPAAPALGRVCRELRIRVNPIYYEENCFVFDDHSMKPDAQAAFRKMAGASAERINKLEIYDTVRARARFSPGQRTRQRTLNFKCVVSKPKSGALEAETEIAGPSLELWHPAKGERPRVCCCKIKLRAEQSAARDGSPKSEALLFLRCYSAMKSVRSPADIARRSLRGCRECHEPHVVL